MVLTVDKAGLQSVGVTQQEGAKLLSKLGVVDGAELSNQGSVDLVVNDTYVHKATSNPTTYEGYCNYKMNSLHTILFEILVII